MNLNTPSDQAPNPPLQQPDSKATIDRRLAATMVLKEVERLRNCAFLLIIAPFAVFGLGVIDVSMSIIMALAAAGAGFYFIYKSRTAIQYLTETYGL